MTFIAQIIFFPNLSEAFSVFGADQRTIVERSSYPFRWVGQLQIAKTSGIFKCTGSLVGPDLVLTNRHCIKDFIGQNLVGKINFFTLYTRKKFLEQSAVSEIVSYSPEHDWTLLRLAEPLGLTVGWLEVAPSATTAKAAIQRAFRPSSFKVLIPGYSGDLENGEVMSVDQNCSVRVILPTSQKGSHEVLHDCDTAKGASGSPILRETKNGKYVIVALHAAQYTLLSSILKDGDKAILSERFKFYIEKYSNLAVDSKRFYKEVKSATEQSLWRFSGLEAPSIFDDVVTTDR